MANEGNHRRRSFLQGIFGVALTGTATTQAAPLRFLRGPDLASPTLADLMPVGEGAGYAGGIASAALDGFRAANVLIERFCPRQS